MYNSQIKEPLRGFDAGIPVIHSSFPMDSIIDT